MTTIWRLHNKQLLDTLPRLRDDEIDKFWLGENWLIHTATVFECCTFNKALRDARRLLKYRAKERFKFGWEIIPNSFYYEGIVDLKYGKGWVFGVFFKQKPNLEADDS